MEFTPLLRFLQRRCLLFQPSFPLLGWHALNNDTLNTRFDWLEDTNGSTVDSVIPCLHASLEVSSKQAIRQLAVGCMVHKVDASQSSVFDMKSELLCQILFHRSTCWNSGRLLVEIVGSVVQTLSRAPSSIAVSSGSLCGLFCVAIQTR